ncbi:MAG: hypothetical protein Q8N45_04085, partial [Anaerolineales bacterium]|nr:hypothetical protein [Anaerolineales bacterium]
CPLPKGEGSARGNLRSKRVSTGFVMDAVWLGECPRGREEGQWRGALNGLTESGALWPPMI